MLFDFPAQHVCVCWLSNFFLLQYVLCVPNPRRRALLLLRNLSIFLCLRDWGSCAVGPCPRIPVSRCPGILLTGSVTQADSWHFYATAAELSFSAPPAPAAPGCLSLRFPNAFCRLWHPRVCTVCVSCVYWLVYPFDSKASKCSQYIERNGWELGIEMDCVGIENEEW